MLLALSEGVSSFVELFTVLLVFVFVLAITYATTKWIGNYQKGKINCRNIQVIETYKVTTNKYIQILRIGNKYLAVAIGKDEMSMLMELDENDIMLDTQEESVKPVDFREIMEKCRARLTKDK